MKHKGASLLTYLIADIVAWPALHNPGVLGKMLIPMTWPHICPVGVVTARPMGGLDGAHPKA